MNKELLLEETYSLSSLQGLSIRTSLARAKADEMRRTGAKPMTKDAFDAAMTGFFSGGEDDIEKPWHDMIDQGYDPARIVDAAEAIARILYTETAVPHDCEMDSKVVPQALCDIFYAVNTSLTIGAVDTSDGVDKPRAVLSEVLGDGTVPGYESLLRMAFIRRLETLEQARPYAAKGKKIAAEKLTEIGHLLHIIGCNLHVMVGNRSYYDGWKMIDIKEPSRYVEILRALGYDLKQKETSEVIRMVADKAGKFNPGKDFVDKIRQEVINAGVFNPEVDYIGAVASMMPDKHNIGKHLLTEWLQRSIQSWQHPGSQRVALILTGEKGAGKDTFAKYVMSCFPTADGSLGESPKTIKDLWHTHNNDPFFSLTRGDFSQKNLKYIKTLLSGRMGVDLSEIQVTSKTDDDFKSIITGEGSDDRAHCSEEGAGKIAYACIIGTCDHISFSASDQHRNRVWELAGDKPTYEYLSIDSSLLWAQAIYELDNGKEFEVTPEIADLYTKAERGIVAVSDLTDELDTNFIFGSDKNDKGAELRKIPASDLRRAVEQMLGHKLRSGQLDEALKKRGCYRSVTNSEVYVGTSSQGEIKTEPRKCDHWMGVYPRSHIVGSDAYKHIFPAEIYVKIQE